jgi:hypothetical protein
VGKPLTDLTVEDIDLIQETLVRMWLGRRRRAAFDAERAAKAAAAATPSVPIVPYPDIGPGGRTTRTCTCDECHRRRAARACSYTARHRFSRGK